MSSRINAQLPPTSDASEFEKMCQAVLCMIYRINYPDYPESTLFQLDGCKGENQHGIDIRSTFTTGDDGSYVVGQCKNYLCSVPQKLQSAADKDIDRIVNELEFPVSCIYIMTSMNRTNKIQNHFSRLYNLKVKENPDFPTIQILFWDEISSYILQSDELLRRFFPEFIITPENEKKIVIFQNDSMDEYNSWKNKQLSIFRAANKKINELLPNQIKNSKTNTAEAFDVEKIINSLLGLGIPMTICFEIAEATANSVYAALSAIPDKDNRELSTGEIRKTVSLAIEEINNPDYTKEDVAKWTNRYARRYGHNDQCLKVYYPRHPEKKDELNYKFIKGTLLDAVIDNIIPKGYAHHEISKESRIDMAEEILAFINQCDLYQINFDLMVSMISEIATQPPHPWLVNDDLRQANLDYDEARIEENLEKLHRELSMKKRISRSIILEILHHSAALILGTHNYFYGCYDMSAVYRLRTVLSYLQDQTQNDKWNDNWNDAIDRTKLSGLLSDLTLSGLISPETNPKNLYDLLSAIENQVENLGTDSVQNFDLIKNAEKLAVYARQIRRCSSKEDLDLFFRTDWSDITREEIIKHIFTIFYTLFPVAKYRKKFPVNDHFGIRYFIPEISGAPINNLKQCFFLIVGLDEEMDIQFLSNLTDSNKKSECNMIIVIAENSEKLSHLQNRITNQLNLLHIGGDYHLLGMTKQDLNEMLYAKDRIKWFFDHYLKQAEEDW